VFKYILVPATGTDTDAPVFATALAVARLSHGHLEFLHVRIDVEQTLAATASGDISGGFGYHQIFDSLERDVADKQRRAELAFRDLWEREKLSISRDPSVEPPSAEWQTEVGEEPAWLAEHGRAADLVVVGRAREGEAVAMDVLEACLMGTRAPPADCSSQNAHPSVRHGCHCVEEPARSRQGSWRCPATHRTGRTRHYLFSRRGRGHR